jgi:RNA polymerase sigma-70 factor (ECF subfamily)
MDLYDCFESRKIGAPDTAALPDDAAARAIDVESLDQALRSLPDIFRQVVVLFYLEEKSYEEICLILGIRMGTLKSRLSRARAMLEETLKPLMKPDETD